MKKGYWVVAYKSISDESATKAYAELAVPALESFGGWLKCTRTNKACSNARALSSLTATKLRWAPTTARPTKRHFGDSAQARNATSASSKVFSPPTQLVQSIHLPQRRWATSLRPPDPLELG